MVGNEAAKEGNSTIMTINERLIEALSMLGIPVTFREFQGDEDRYIVFDYNTIPIDFADDEPDHEKYLIQVHLFCPLGTNSISDTRKIKEALFEAGMTWPEMTDASDKDSQHLVFECENAEGIDYGED